MRIDVKTLRIRSHVEYDGKQMVVASVSNKPMNCENLILIEPSTLTLYKNVNSYDVEPISITPELLKELGFEDCAKKRWHTEDWEKRWGECQYLSFTKLYRGEWRVHYFDGAKDRGQTVVRYLHEAEAFLALHGVELIKQ